MFIATKRVENVSQLCKCVTFSDLLGLICVVTYCCFIKNAHDLKTVEARAVPSFLPPIRLTVYYLTRLDR